MRDANYGGMSRGCVERMDEKANDDDNDDDNDGVKK